MCTAHETKNQKNTQASVAYRYCLLVCGGDFCSAAVLKEANYLHQRGYVKFPRRSRYRERSERPRTKTAKQCGGEAPESDECRVHAVFFSRERKIVKGV